MNEDLRRLIRLQEILLVIDELKTAIAALPAGIARLEKDQIAAEKRLEAERTAVQEAQKERRKFEMELMGVEARIAKYQAQLHEVKTNKEYQAMQHEIETCRAERAALDERILTEMEAGETHAGAIKKVEEEVAAVRRATQEGKARIRVRQQEMEGRAQVLETERVAIAGEIGKAYLDPFLKMAKQRKGLALVAVRDGLCGGCNVRVLPRLVQMVRRSTGLIACDSCKRYLYVIDDPAKGAPAETGPAAEDPAAEGPTAEGAAADGAPGDLSGR